MNYLRVTFLSLVIIASLYFVYSKYFLQVKGQDITLSEEQEEHKRKPVDPGGIVIPHSSSLIYEKLSPKDGTISKVNLLQAPEEPMVLAFKTNQENLDEIDSIDDILAKLELQEDGKIFQDELAGENVTDPEVDTPNLADSTIVQEDESVYVTQSGLKITKLSEETNKLNNLNINSVDFGYKIQLSSSWSEKEAKNEWKKIQARHMKYLKNAQLVIKTVKANNGKIIYLVMAGNYSSLNQAKLVCKKLSLAKQNCIVTK